MTVLRRYVLMVALFGLSVLYGLALGSPLAMVLGVLVGFLLASGWFVLDRRIERMTYRGVAAATTGGAVGTVIAILFAQLLFPGSLTRSTVYSVYEWVLFWGILAFGGTFGVVQGLILAEKYDPGETGESGEQVSPKILDTSVIIDGRVAEITEIGFLEGTFLIPRFVLKELQTMADSGNKLKRNRGRRGLDILNKIRSELPIPVEITEDTFPDIQEVDAKLVALAKQRQAKILTNDFNLNKVASLQDIQVLNINDLSNAVKPVYIPGETFEIEVIKEGEEQEQGVGYLEDGTMVVIEKGREYVGESVKVTVTSVIQTSAGRMIFTELGSNPQLTA